MLNSIVSLLVERLNAFLKNNNSNVDSDNKNSTVEEDTTFEAADESFFSDAENTSSDCDMADENTVILNEVEMRWNAVANQKNNYRCDKYVKDMDIADMDLSVRIYNCLRRAGIQTLRDIKSLSYAEISKVRNLGKKCTLELIETLEEMETVVPEIESGFDNNKSPMDLLNNLIGLDDVKYQVKRIAAFARMKKDMVEKSNMSISMNMAFLGNPGTAKTTVARILAGIFYELGLTKSPEIVEVSRADLVGKYLGETAVKTQSVFNRAMGKILFIDEAYSLVERDGLYGDEAINTIVSEMENNREHTFVIFAGYPDKMKDFFEKNAGLKSRVPFTINFNDYSADDMMQIVEQEASERGFTIAPSAVKDIFDVCVKATNNTENGNGRFCRNLVDDAVLNYAYRVYGGEEIVNNDMCLVSSDFGFTVCEEARENPIGFRC